MTRFVLSVLSNTHQILTTSEAMPPSAGPEIQRAFDAWKRQGGAMIISDCLVVDRHGVEIELDLSASAAEARHERLLLDPLPACTCAVSDWTVCPRHPL